MTWNQTERNAFSNISASTAAFVLNGGLYGVTVQGSNYGTVTLQRLSGDGSTYITVLTAFSANGYATVSLPQGSYRLTIASATAVYADVTSIVTNMGA